jgi:hypothetical protein
VVPQMVAIFRPRAGRERVNMHSCVFVQEAPHIGLGCDDVICAVDRTHDLARLRLRLTLAH